MVFLFAAMSLSGIFVNALLDKYFFIKKCSEEDVH